MSSALDAVNASMDGASVLITGGLGFIGSNMAHRCVGLGAKVTLLDANMRFAHNIKGIEGKARVLEGDIRDAAVVAEAVKGQDVIFHFAGQTSHTAAMAAPRSDLEVNCGGTLNVLEAARVASPRAAILFAGSVTAALFLKRFVENAKRYAHLDIYGWVPREQPGRPRGGEPHGARAFYEYLRGELSA